MLVVLALAAALMLPAIAQRHVDRNARVANPSAGAPSVVAVMPFSVQGSSSFAYLGGGVADLLSSSLDGAGRLRAVDSRVILEAAGANAGRDLDPRAAAALARRVDAQYYVLGKIVEVAGRLRIVAYLFDGNGGASPLGQESVESAPDSVFAAVDELAAKLLAKRFRMPRERLSRSAAMTTTSLPALKAFLAGESAFRDGRYAEAADHYKRAVTIDTTFALAYYRSSQSLDRTGRDEDVLPAAERALRFAAHLSAQDSLLVSAFLAWRTGRLDDAERLYRAEVADHPDDVEGWFQLGELLFYGNPLRGRTSAESRGAFERVLALDPDDGEALLHLARIASSQGRAGEVDSLVRRVLALAPARDVLEMRSFRAFALGDRQGQKRVTSELLASPGSIPAETALGAAVYADDLDRVERFASLLTEDRHSSDVRGYGHRLLAQTAAARGQWRAAQRELDGASRFDPTAALELRSLLAVLPFLPVTRSELEEMRATLERWQPPVEESEGRIHSTAHVGVHPALRLHRLGLVSARLGATTAALRYARELESARDAGHDSVERAIVRTTFARSIQARVADAAGQPERALTLLDQAQWHPIASGFMAEALDRYYRADLLRRLGRVDEARGWYRSIAERTTYELVYLAPARFQLAQMAEAQGTRDLAITRYRSLIGAWSNADPELAPLVQDARRRLARLGG
jgi:tetratricopeptide (TPR) repeat protein